MLSVPHLGNVLPDAELKSCACGVSCGCDLVFLSGQKLVSHGCKEGGAKASVQPLAQDYLKETLYCILAHVRATTSGAF